MCIAVNSLTHVFLSAQTCFDIEGLQINVH